MPGLVERSPEVFAHDTHQEQLQSRDYEEYDHQRGPALDHSGDAVLAVFASHAYDPADYVRQYDEFQALCAAKVGGTAQGK